MDKVIDFGKILSEKRAKILLQQAKREFESAQISVEYWKQQIKLLEGLNND